MRLLITDPFHPVVQTTIAALKSEYGDGCHVIGISPITEIPPPPLLDGLELCPRPDAPSFEVRLLDVVRRERIDTVLPWTDADALALGRATERLARAGATLVGPPWRLVRLACDKWSTLERLTAIGIPVPMTRLVASASEVESAALELGYPAHRLILKPRCLAGSAGVWSVRPDFDLQAHGPRAQLPLEAIVAAVRLAVRRDGPMDYLLQQEVTGTDVSVDAVAHDGRVLSRIVRTRDATLGGLCVQGRVLVSPTSLNSLIDELIAGLGWSNLINVQLIMDRAGQPFVYEINGRAAGSIGIASYSGADLLRTAIEYSRTGASSSPDGFQAITPITFRRYWNDQWWPTDS
jgi:carbamoyl-phosphate synthase large subunit